MKTLSAGQTTALAAKGIAVYRIARVSWPDPIGTVDYSDRGCTVAGTAAEELILGWPDFRRQMTAGLKPEVVVSQAQITLRNDEDATYPIAQTLETLIAGQGVRIQFFLVFGDSTPAAEDLNCVGDMVITDWEIENEQVRLTCEDYWAQRGMQSAGRPITADEFPTAPDGSFGRLLPWIFGEVTGCPCYPVTAGLTARLDGSLDIGERVVYVDGVAGFTAPGTVIIGAEEIYYTAIDAVNKSFGTSGSPVTRGYNGTTQVDHGDGVVVREKLTTYRFVVADHACHNLADEDEVTVELGGKNVSATVAVVDGRTYLDIASLPTIAEIMGGVTRTDLDGEDGGWQDAGDSTCDTYDGETIIATSAEGMVDGGDLRHVSGAILDPANTKGLASVTYDTVQTSRAGQFVKGRLEVDYKVVPGEGEETAGDGFSWGSPTIEILRGGSRVALANVGKPSEQDLQGFLADADITAQLEDSRPLFEFTAGVVGSSVSYPALYLSGTENIDLEFSWATNDRLRSWYSAAGPSDTQVGVALQSTENAATFELTYNPDDTPVNSPGTKYGNHLILKPDPAIAPSEEDIYTSITAVANLKSVNSVNKPTVWGKLEIGGQSKTVTVTMPVAPASVNLSVTVTGEFTKAEVEAARFTLERGSVVFTVTGIGINRSLNVTVKTYHVTSASISCGTKPAQVGLEERLEGTDNTLADQGLLGGSRTLTQKINLTTYIKDNFGSNPWSFFDGDLAVKVLADTGTAPTRIIIYDCRFVVEERAQTVRQLTDEEAVAYLTVQGVASGGSLLESPADVIGYLLTDSNWLGLEAGEVDSTSLASALTGRSAWKFARRFDQETEIREAVAQACRDAGIRMAWEGGRMRFSPIGSMPTEASQAVTRAQMMGTIKRRPARMELIANQVAVYFARSMDDRRVFQRVTADRNDEASQANTWGVRRATLDAEWIRDTWTANQLAAAMLADAAHPRALIEMEGALAWTGHEIGDAVSITDADAGMTGLVGRLMAGSFPGDRVRLTALGPTGFVRFWTDPLDASNYINVLIGGQRRMTFYIGNAVVATLTGNGMWVANGFTQTSLGEISMSETVEFDAGNARILIAVNEGGATGQVAGMGITSEGIVQCYMFSASALYPVAQVYQSDYIELQQERGWTWFSNDLRSNFAVLQPGSANGDLPGQSLLEAYGFATEE